MSHFLMLVITLALCIVSSEVSAREPIEGRHEPPPAFVGLAACMDIAAVRDMLTAEHAESADAIHAANQIHGRGSCFFLSSGIVTLIESVERLENGILKGFITKAEHGGFIVFIFVHD